MEKEIYIENNKKFKMAERYQTFLSDFSKKKNIQVSFPKSIKQASVISNQDLAIVDSLVGEGLLCLNDQGSFLYCSKEGDCFDNYLDYLKKETDIESIFLDDREYELLKIEGKEIIFPTYHQKIGIITKIYIGSKEFIVYQYCDSEKIFSSAAALAVYFENAIVNRI